MFGYFQIKNHNNKTLRGRIIPPQQENPLVVFVHGLGGGMFEPQYRVLKNTLTKAGLGVCLFDMVNGLGASSKDIVNLSVEDYYQDLVSVLNYVFQQGYSNIILIGHSLGGGLVLKLLESNSDLNSFIRGVVLINPYCMSAGTYFEDISKIITLLPYRITRFHHFIDLTLDAVTSMNTFDTISGANRITTPLFVIRGKYDKTIPEIQTRELLKHLQNAVVFKEYEFFGHAFLKPQPRKHLPELCNEILVWIQTIKGKK